VPVIGCSCDVCTSSDPKDRRTRVSAVVEASSGQRILIDTPPEVRLQLVGAGIGSVDAVLYTHDHADHVHGIDDLRALSAFHGPLHLFGPADSIDCIKRRFDYIFDGSPAPEQSSKPELSAHPLPAGERVSIAGMDVLPVVFDHGRTIVYGYRFGNFAYLTDVKRVSAAAFDLLEGVEVLVINALFEKTHPAHLSIPEAIEAAERIGASRTLLTHLTHRYSHADLCKRLPAGVEPAYDGATIVFDEG